MLWRLCCIHNYNLSLAASSSQLPQDVLRELLSSNRHLQTVTFFHQTKGHFAYRRSLFNGLQRRLGGAQLLLHAFNVTRQLQAALLRTGSTLRQVLGEGLDVAAPASIRRLGVWGLKFVRLRGAATCTRGPLRACGGSRRTLPAANCYTLYVQQQEEEYAQ